MFQLTVWSVSAFWHTALVLTAVETVIFFTLAIVPPKIIQWSLAKETGRQS